MMLSLVIKKNNDSNTVLQAFTVSWLESRALLRSRERSFGVWVRGEVGKPTKCRSWGDGSGLRCCIPGLGLGFRGFGVHCWAGSQDSDPLSCTMFYYVSLIEKSRERTPG